MHYVSRRILGHGVQQCHHGPSLVIDGLAHALDMGYAIRTGSAGIGYSDRHRRSSDRKDATSTRIAYLVQPAEPALPSGCPPDRLGLSSVCTTRAVSQNHPKTHLNVRIFNISAGQRVFRYTD